MSALAVDSSFLVTALLADDQQGVWATGQLDGPDLIGPHLLPVETVNILHRSVSTGIVTEAQADGARQSMERLRIGYYPFNPFSERIWELRHNLTSYDAWYVAVAEHFDAPMATIDLRLARSPGPRCSFLVPPEL